MASACCPIETEPRTLREGQLNHAREVAADVIQKMEPNKAASIFTEGLKPINPTNDARRWTESKEEVGGEPIKSQKHGAECMEKPCQCSCTSGLSESPDQPKLKEPVSAPF